MAVETQLIDRLLSSPQLPSMPAVAMQILDLVREDEVSVEKIADVVSLDAALSSKMLKTVNSSLYGLPTPIGSVNQAAIALGLNSVKTLALGFSVVSALTEADGRNFDPAAFWKRSLYCATAAKQLCEQLEIQEAEEVFIAALLQDVGVLALVQVLGEEYAKVLRAAGGDHRRLGAIERATLGADHAAVGGALAESWGLPGILVEALRFHEQADEADEAIRPLVRIVHASACAAEAIVYPDDAERINSYRECHARWFDLSDDQADELFEATCRRAKETQKLFELPVGELLSPNELLSRANQALEQLSLAGAIATGQLRKANRELKERATHDTVTGLYNRRHFDEKLDENFLEAGPDLPLSLLFVDLDHFKSVNDTHGHVTGDAVLLAIANGLAQVSRGKADVFRYGGDEFVLLARGMARNDAAVLAEQLRLSILDAMQRVALNDSEEGPSVTGSIGVATYDGAVFKRSDQLVKAADKGAYAAKTSGRNVVRVFVPKAA